MTRRMIDALFPNQIPLDVVAPGDLVATYVGHSSNLTAVDQAIARFPTHQVVTIAAKTHADAQILDVEHQAVEPTDYPTMNAWGTRQRAFGRTPIIYVNAATWPSVRPHLVGPWDWWSAKWDGQPTIPAGAVGVQYTGAPGYDLSVMVDYIQGIDGGHDPSGGGTPIPTPIPVPVPMEDDDMFLAQVNPGPNGEQPGIWLVGGPGGYAPMVDVSDVASFINAGVKQLAINYAQHEAFLTAAKEAL